MSNSLDPDQGGHLVVPDLGPNCLQKLSADDLENKTTTTPPKKCSNASLVRIHRFIQQLEHR